MALNVGSNNPISDIKNQIEGAVGGIKSLVGLDSLAKYPTRTWTDDVINKVKENSGDWKKSRGYEFQVMEVTYDGHTVPFYGWDALKLQINPQELSQDEIFAVEITPTFGGVLVEHQGSLLKDITISGTTGVSPFRTQGGVFTNGRPVLAGGHSGYMEFHELRNYFRAYAEEKRRPTIGYGAGIVMAFRNLKDREYLLVEPTKFKLKRTSAKSLSYHYTIEMKAIGREDRSFQIGHWLDKAFDFLETANNLLDDAILIMENAADFIRGVMRDFISAILSPLKLLAKAIGAYKVLDRVTRGFIEGLKGKLETLENDLNDALGRDNTAYNETLGRTPTIRGKEGRVSTYEELQVLNSIQKSKTAMSLLLQDNKLFQEDSNNEYVRVEDTYTDSRGNKKVSMKQSPATKEVTIDGSDTIQTLAARELSDPDMFREIVVVNNLKPPYISTDTAVVAASGGRVKAPGDKIIIPQKGRGNVVVARGKEYNITKQLQEFEKNMGVDIALTKDNDIAIANIGDADLVGGFDNLSQAIYLKLFYRKGSLKRHPSIGTNLGVGEKATNVENERKNVESSIASDPRIESVPFSEIEQDGNVTNIKMVLKVKDVDQPIPLPLTT